MTSSSSSCAHSKIIPNKTLLGKRVAEDYSGGCGPDLKRSRNDGEHSDQETDWRVEQVLGPLRNDFEKGIWGDRLGPQFGGYGSFLPAYKSHSVAKVPVYEGKVVEYTVDDRIEGALGQFRKYFHGELWADRLEPMFGGYGSFLPAEIRKPKPPVPALLPDEIQKSNPPVPVLLPAEIRKPKIPVPALLSAEIQKPKPLVPALLPAQIRKAKPPVPISLPAQISKVKPLVPKFLPREKSVAQGGIGLVCTAKCPTVLPTPSPKPVATTAPPVQSNGTETAPAKLQRVSIDSLLEDIKKGKSFKLRVVFGSEKRMQKAVGEEANKCPDVTPIESKVVSKVADSSTGRGSRTRKPAGMAQKMKKIANTVKRINRSHCPAAFVRGKIPRLC